MTPHQSNPIVFGKSSGIRCERATALLNQMTAARPDDCRPRGVYHMRGGIERYVKTFQRGGFWKGKNYLFDRRAEQRPGSKTDEQVEDETDSQCCLCRQKWTVYRGKFKCSQSLCGVPVIVCESCRPRATEQPKSLTCELCKIGYRAPKSAPDLVGLKRKAESLVSEESVETSGSTDAESKTKNMERVVKNRLFLGRLPLTATKKKIADALSGEVELVHWMTDRRTGAFYGSCLVQLASADVAQAATKRDVRVDKKKVKVSLARTREGETWPPINFQEREYPPVGR